MQKPKLAKLSELNTSRPRRNRGSPQIRALIQETVLRPDNLVLPLFLVEGRKQKIKIPSMPDVFRLSLDEAIKEISKALELGIHAVILFPVVPEKKKDKDGSEALNSKGLIPTAIRTIKAKYPQATVFADVALDPYSSHGHDGLVQGGKILNDETIEVLCQQALVQAEAGIDFVAPSDMMDGRVGAIREALDQAGFTGVGILSYCAKYASAYYGPFRDALSSAPKFGDKKTYQMDPSNRREALREMELDQAEGADMLMVKPALAYLDVIAALRQHSHLPIAAYQVSGEYSMVKAAAAAGWLDGDRVMMENLTAIRRAGADIIVTYWAMEAARLLRKV